MRHLDEATLRAYLDETADGRKTGRYDVLRHFAVCAECRDSLEAARQRWEETPGMPSPAKPERDAEPLVEEPVAAGLRARFPSRFSPVTATALVAILFLASGLGWYLRSVRSASGEVDLAPTLRDEPVATPTGPPVVAEATLPAGRSPAAEAPDTPADPPAVAAAEVRAETRDQASMAPESLPAAVAPSVPEPQVREESLADELPEAPPVWIELSAEEAELRMGPLAVLPDLPLIGISMSRTEPAMARLRFQLLEGVSVELVQQRVTELARADSTADSIATTAGRSGFGSASMDWRGFRITVIGPLSADSLRGLLRRLPQP